MKKEIKELIAEKQTRIVEINTSIQKTRVKYDKKIEMLSLERSRLLEEIRMLYYKNK